MKQGQSNTLNNLSDFFLRRIECDDPNLPIQLEEYFNGERFKFDLKYEINGTDFQKAVLKVMLKIPYGKTMSYQQVATLAGYENAQRAVGSVCNRNKLPIIIPCHRVVSKHGIGGYGYGLEIKEHLLGLERNSLAK